MASSLMTVTRGRGAYTQLPHTDQTGVPGQSQPPHAGKSQMLSSMARGLMASTTRGGSAYTQLPSRAGSIDGGSESDEDNPGA